MGGVSEKSGALLIFKEVNYVNKKEPKDQSIHFRMTNEEMRELEMASYLDNRTKSDFVRRTLNYYYHIKKYAPEIIEEFEKEVKNKHE